MYVVFVMRRAKIGPLSARYRHKDDIDNVESCDIQDR